MKLVRPIKINFCNHKFGENRISLYKDLGLKGHNGWDWVGREGVDIRWDCTDCEGIVQSTYIDKYGGLGVTVLSHDLDGDFKHVFWHLSEFKCKAGDRLSSGDLIGLCDSTGLSTGNHLHRGLKKAINIKGVWRTKNYNNGYWGAIDPTPYFKANIYIKDYMDNLYGQISVIKKIIELMKHLMSKRSK